MALFLTKSTFLFMKIFSVKSSIFWPFPHILKLVKGFLMELTFSLCEKNCFLKRYLKNLTFSNFFLWMQFLCKKSSAKVPEARLLVCSLTLKQGANVKAGHEISHPIDQRRDLNKLIWKLFLNICLNADKQILKYKHI